MRNTFKTNRFKTCTALPAVVLAALAMTSCTTATQSNPSRTATEELLISTAAERSAQQLTLPVAKGKNVFIDASNFDGTDSKYAVGAIRENVLRRGAILSDDKKKADTIIEVRAGALSTDQTSFLVGIPQFNIPVPLASGPLTFPEIALYKTADQKGVAKFVMFAYDAKTGAMLPPQEPKYGFSNNIQTTVLIFFSWTENDALPSEGDNPITRAFYDATPQKTGASSLAPDPATLNPSPSNANVPADGASAMPPNPSTGTTPEGNPSASPVVRKSPTASTTTFQQGPVTTASVAPPGRTQ